MEIGQPSRFACLKIEDEDAIRNGNKLKNKKKDSKKPVSSTLVTKSTIKTDKSGNPTSKKINASQNANGKLSQQASSVASSSTSKKDKKQNFQQWEEWKEKDHEIVNGTYELDLEKAILASLEYQNKTEQDSKVHKTAETEKSQNKKKKNKAMSLDQFLKSDKNDKVDLKIEPPIGEGDFFAKVQQETKKELNKEEVKEIRKKREANIDEIVSQAQYQEKLQHEKKRIEELERLLQKSKEELLTVRERNKTLCNLLSNGEMKDKASALLEIENINVEKSELTAEVSRLHIENQQLRSKLAVYETVNNKHKEKKRKPKAA